MNKIVLIGLLICTACISRPNKATVGETSGVDSIKEISLKGICLVTDSALWGMKIDYVCDNRLFIQELGNTKQYGIYKVNGTKLQSEGSFLKKGNGPYEVLHPDLWGHTKDSAFYISNFPGKLDRIYRISMKDVLDEKKWEVIQFPEPQKEMLFFPSVAIMNDSCCVLTGSGVNSESILSYMNFKSGEITELSFKFPGFRTAKDPCVMEHLVYCDAQLLKHPSLDKLLYACRSGRYMHIIEIQDKKIKRVIPLFSQEPSYEMNSKYKRLKEDSYRGIIAKATENFVYGLIIPYTKKEAKANESYKSLPNYFSDQLYVFDWDGNLIRKYLLDRPVCSFDVDETKGVLYATSYDSSNEPIVIQYNF